MKTRAEILAAYDSVGGGVRGDIEIIRALLPFQDGYNCTIRLESALNERDAYLNALRTIFQRFADMNGQIDDKYSTNTHRMIVQRVVSDLLRDGMLTEEDLMGGST